MFIGPLTDALECLGADPALTGKIFEIFGDLSDVRMNVFERGLHRAVFERDASHLESANRITLELVETTRDSFGRRDHRGESVGNTARLLVLECHSLGSRTLGGHFDVVLEDLARVAFEIVDPPWAQLLY